MYVKLKGYIEITRKDGKCFSFYGFHSVDIELDIFKINQTCKVQIPVSCRLVDKDANVQNSIQTATLFTQGDKISVWLGYNDNKNLEFEGFIYRINYKSPLEIECEGYEYQLRSPCETKTWVNTTMVDVLNYLISGTDIILSQHVAGMNFTKYIIPANMTKLEALQLIKEKYRMTIFTMGKTLYVGLAYTLDRGTVKYKLGYNTINADDLKYKNADDISLKIKAVWIKPDNTKVEVEVGDRSGSQRTIFMYNVSSKQQLEKMALEEMKKWKYSGYEGKIKTFLHPFAQPCMKGKLSDPKYSERNGTYYITKTTVKADMDGGRRTVEFTVKL